MLSVEAALVRLAEVVAVFPEPMDPEVVPLATEAV
jgi:hypothetical protein